MIRFLFIIVVFCSSIGKSEQKYTVKCKNDKIGNKQVKDRQECFLSDLRYCKSVLSNIIREEDIDLYATQYKKSWLELGALLCEALSEETNQTVLIHGEWKITALIRQNAKEVEGFLQEYNRLEKLRKQLNKIEKSDIIVLEEAIIDFFRNALKEQPLQINH